MPFERQKLTQLCDDTLQDMADAAIYDTTTAQLAAVTMFLHSPLECIGYGISGGVYSAYGYLDYIALQSTPWGATDEIAVGWGSLKGKTRKPASFATGSEIIVGPVDTDIPAAATMLRPDGFAYQTNGEVTIGSSGMAAVAFTAVVTGAAGNAAIGTTLRFGSPVNGITSIVTANAIGGGAEIEDFGAFKARYLRAYADPPAGGSATDYVQWAEAVPGVTRAWCSPTGMGAGTVVVYTMWDGANAPWGGFPQGSNGVATYETRDAAAQGDQLTVANAIYGPTGPTGPRPVTALVYSCAPAPLPQNFVLADLAAANNATTIAAIEVALDAMFRRLADPLGTRIYPSAWEAAINGVAGLPNFTVVSPNAPISPATGQLPVRGTVTVVP